MRHFLALPATICAALILGGCNEMDRVFGQKPLAIAGAPANFDSRGFNRIVVLPKVGKDIESEVEAAFAAALLTKGFVVVERSDLDRVLKEIGLQSDSGLTDTTNALKVGKMLNADGLLIITCKAENRNRTTYANGPSTEYSTYVTASVKCVSIQQGAQVWVATYSDERYVDVRKAVSEVVKALAEAFPSKNPAPVAPAPQP